MSKEPSIDERTYAYYGGDGERGAGIEERQNVGNEKGKKEIFIGRDSFNNELSLISNRPLGEEIKIRERQEKAGIGDSPSDYFNEIEKEIRFRDGKQEPACRFLVEFTNSVVSEPRVTVIYLSPEVQISELGAQSGKRIVFKPGHFGAQDLTEKEKN